MVMNKTGKVEVHITDNKSWKSCCRVVSDHESALSSATKHNALWPCTMHGCLLQPQHGVPTAQVHLSTLLSFALSVGLNSVEKQLQACLRHHRNSGTQAHQNCYFNLTEVLMGVETMGSFEILSGLWLETNENVHLWSIKTQSVLGLLSDFGNY